MARHIARSRDRSATSAPEQQKNIAAIVWLYRGQQERFLKPVESYIAQAISEGEAATAPLEGFEEVLGKLIDLIEPFASIKRKDDPLAEPWDELTEGQATLAADNEAFAAEVAARVARWARTVRDNTRFAEARMALHPLADRCRDLTKQIDLAAKLASVLRH